MHGVEIRERLAEQTWPVVRAMAMAAFLVTGCQTDPQKVDVQLPETAPEVKTTNYTKALGDLGRMSEVYDRPQMKVMAAPVGDVTGSSSATGGEIPSDITEMEKSTLNSIGGRVLYVPYDPVSISNLQALGYSTFANKAIPDVLVTGGITEFDRGIETRGKNTDVGLSVTSPKPIAGGWLGQTAGIEYGESDKYGVARITLDFNMVDFQTQSGIPRMNTINSMEVHKAQAEAELGITLFGPTFGTKGSIKKVQGRHAAVRLLVEASMIQMIGKYLKLPYWRLLGEDTPDPVVLEAIQKAYYSVDDLQRLKVAQQWLYIWGYPTAMDGTMDSKTGEALKKVNPSFKSGASSIDMDTFTKLYVDMPYDHAALGRRQQLARITGKADSAVAAEAPTSARSPQAPQAAQQAPAPAKAAAPAPQAAQQAPSRPAPAPAPAPEKKAASAPPPPQTPAKADVADQSASTTAPKTQKTSTTTSAPVPGSAGGAVGRMLKEGDW